MKALKETNLSVEKYSRQKSHPDFLLTFHVFCLICFCCTRFVIRTMEFLWTMELLWNSYGLKEFQRNFLGIPKAFLTKSTRISKEFQKEFLQFLRDPKGISKEFQRNFAGMPQGISKEFHKKSKNFQRNF